MAETHSRCAQCSSSASLQCSRCSTEKYCSSTCQTASWPTHKLACRGLLPSFSRIWIIHPKSYAPAHSDDPLASRESVKAHLQAWDMKDGVFGNEAREKEAIRKKFGWAGADEGGKTYNKAGDNKWFYYQYCSSSERVTVPSTSSNTTNPLGSLFAFQGAVRRQPVVLVKSGFGDMGDSKLSLEGLVDTILWYGKEGARQASVFQKREDDRNYPNGVPEGYVSIHTSERTFDNHSDASREFAWVG